MAKKNLINGKPPEFGNIEQIKVLQQEEKNVQDEKDVKSFYKSLPPLAKYIDDLASIDWCIMVLQNKTKEVTEKLNGRSPIAAMVDKATGYQKDIIRNFLLSIEEGYTELIKLFKRIKDADRIKEYSDLLAKVKEALKTDYK